MKKYLLIFLISAFHLTSFAQNDSIEINFVRNYQYINWMSPMRIKINSLKYNLRNNRTYTFLNTSQDSVTIYLNRREVTTLSKNSPKVYIRVKYKLSLFPIKYHYEFITEEEFLERKERTRKSFKVLY